ncbi:MAG: MFS transporter [Betaproteobacteria bacterium]|nr:MFS transporter [Pseudomonadota bacterium]NBO11714.1 MFS transporter [Betaproteobacteria bacterium]NBO43696.1 MFS transporter [Betaproteobacteria bacterium]NBP10395.1 MFS transporter [Betaproteobacteria bacterium]NBP60815.1 MFS transporter [Betaproteobacteria bacterium]
MLWRWIPTLYFTQALPYAVVMSLAVVMFKDLALSNAEIAWITGWFYLPWVIKPLWSPLLTLFAGERHWTLWMQAFISFCFACIVMVLMAQSSSWLLAVVGLMWAIAFASATHDVAADGFYLRILDPGSQARFVGVRSLAFRLAMLSVSGGVVSFVGLLLERSDKPFEAWSIAFLMIALGMGLLACWHHIALPRYAEPQFQTDDLIRQDEHHRPVALSAPARGNGPPQARSIGSILVRALAQYRVVLFDFFQQSNLWPTLCFLLFYRFSESQLLRLLIPFLMDSEIRGGMALSHAELGLSYGGLGVVALSLGGLWGGYCIARWGLRRLLWPMVWCLNVPNLAYALLAWDPLTGKSWAFAAIALEQLGYGFGFAGYLVFMMRVSEGQHATAHYAICTGLMALGMMLPGMPAGWIQMQVGYPGFFAWVLISTVPSFISVMWVMKRGLGLESR